MWSTLRKGGSRTTPRSQSGTRPRIPRMNRSVVYSTMLSIDVNLFSPLYDPESAVPGGLGCAMDTHKQQQRSMSGPASDARSLGAWVEPDGRLSGRMGIPPLHPPDLTQSHPRPSPTAHLGDISIIPTPSLVVALTPLNSIAPR